MRRGILGGTFDPPHMAHLIAGETAHQQLDLDVVTYLPAGAPWQKADQDVTSAAHRWRMTQLAIDGVGYFEADDREVTRDGWTYTSDTVAEYDPEDELFLILGSDAAAGLSTWHNVGDVLDRCTIVVAPRPGPVPPALPEGARTLDMPNIDISGTELRRRARRGRSLRFLVRDRVWAYIQSNRLYE